MFTAIILSAIITLAELTTGILILSGVLSANVGGIIILALIAFGIVFDISAVLIIKAVRRRKFLERFYLSHI